MLRRPLLILLLAALVGALAGAIGGIAAQRQLVLAPGAAPAPAPATKESLIADYYAVENAAHVSPHGLRVKMQQGDTSFTLVDLRSAEEYAVEHVAGAVNIPAYSDKATSAYGDVERIVGAFRALPKDRTIIVYCYSTACMTGRKIGLMLAEHGVYVQHLGIGWNEWRHDWTAWNHEWEWATTKVEDFIATGTEPGTPKRLPVDPTKPCVVGQFGC